MGLADGVELLGLSPQEAEVAKARLHGETVEGAAYILSVSAHTVRTYIKRIYRKLGVNSVVGLATVVQKASETRR